MTSGVVIDYNILGWGEKHRAELVRKFGNVILVGKHSDLSRRSFDKEVAAYCDLHDCALITADARAYTHFFESGIEKVEISRIERWDVSDADLFMVEIVRKVAPKT
jgi:hypothetical protein